MSNDIHALSGAYVVDALDATERAEFEQHLAVCETCRGEVADLRAAATEIAATTEATPPPGLRASVLAGIGGVRPLPPLDPAAAPAPAPEPAVEVAPVTRLHRRRVWRSIGAAAAAAALVAGGTTVVLHPWDRPAESSYSAADRVIHAADVQRFDGDVHGGGRVVVYRSVALDRAVVVARGFGAAPSGRVYQLWLQAPSGTMRPAGLFDDGSDLQQVLSGRAGSAKAMGITVERAGGSPVPTTQPIALVPMA